MLPPKWQENRNLKVRLIFRWITFLEKQHSNYFWLVLTAGGICSNFINTNQNSLPNSLAHTRKTWHGANVTDQTLKWAKESNSTWDDWWIFGLIWSFFSGLSKLHILGQRNGVGGGWRQYVRDRTLKGRRKKKSRAKRLVGGIRQEVKGRSVWKKKKKKEWIFLNMFTFHQFKYEGFKWSLD